MKMRWITWALALALAGVTTSACDSLVTGECAGGWTKTDGVCARLGGGPDAATPGPDGATGVDARPDAGAAPDAHPSADAGPSADATPMVDAEPMADAGWDVDAEPTPDATTTPDALTCAPPTEACDGVCIDTSADPANCGGCGVICPSGICAAGACVGATSGHVVAIGHDFVEHSAAAARLLGNALTLGGTEPSLVGEWRGTASDAARAATITAATAGLAAQGRTWTRVELDVGLSQLPQVRVVLIHAQHGDPAADFALGVAWAPTLTAFVEGGGVVIGVEGEAGSTHAILAGAGLLAISSTAALPASDLTLVAPADALAPGVLSPYRSGATSVVFDAVGATPVVTDALGRPVVIRTTLP
ncbi:MAG: hypothetical protein R2939_03345 [Kofleriaceae bacterium]